MPDSRKALDRKDELKLYEWMKEHYDKLQGKTVNEGTAVVRDELGLDISGNTLVSMTRDMDMQPFWRVRSHRIEHGGHDDTDHDASEQLHLIHELLARAQTQLVQHSKALMQLRDLQQNLQDQIHKLTEISRNIVVRLEKLERENII